MHSVMMLYRSDQLARVKTASSQLQLLSIRCNAPYYVCVNLLKALLPLQGRKCCR